VGFKPTIPVFEWAKTFRALDCAATVIGIREVQVSNLGRDTFYPEVFIVLLFLQAYTGIVG
jgi:hypothetical protein